MQQNSGHGEWEQQFLQLSFVSVIFQLKLWLVIRSTEVRGFNMHIR